jgi:hypothetical protein
MELAPLILDEREVKPQQPANMYSISYTEVSRSTETPLYLKKEQRINDRLQDKINILKSQAQSQENMKQISQINDQKVAKEASVTSILRKSKESEAVKK